MTTELNTDEYNSTLTDRMSNVTGITAPAADIWPYVKELVNENIIAAPVFEQQLVEIVYRNEDNTFNHFLLPAAQPNIFIVILVDLVQQTIKGHYRLDLNEVFGVE